VKPPVLVRFLYVAAVLGAFAIGITLWAWGQPLISTNGEVRLWVGSIWSSQNSQQVADWYTLSHVIHGMLVVLVGRAFGRWIGYPVLLAVAIATGVAWEILEHTDWVLGQFRATTVYQGYLGDTVLNAVCDYVFMLAGFFLASVLRTLWVFALIVILEIGSALIARDSLALATLQLVHPIPAIAAWQDEINPRTHPDLQVPSR
jgi:hypothetical protein